MAENSKREQIILANKALIESVSTIKTINRVLPEYKELQNFAQTQFPVCAVVGRMPVPEEKISSRGIQVDQIKSEIKVDIFTYLQINTNIDTLISDVADDLWKQLYTDQSRNGLVIKTTLEVNEKISVWNPFAAFQITAVHKYIHDSGGI